MMFVGMFLALPLYFLIKYWKQSAAKTNETNEKADNDFSYQKLSSTPSENNERSSSDAALRKEDEEMKNETEDLFNNWRKGLRVTLFLSIPSLFDLVATVLGNKGLLAIDVSVYQLLKCTVIVFVALIKRFIMKTKYMKYMWFGIFLNTVAVCVVALTSFFPSARASLMFMILSDDSGTINIVDPGSQLMNDYEDDQQIHTKATSTKLLGVFFVVLSCLVQSVQYVFEELIMSEPEADSADTSEGDSEKGQKKDTQSIWSIDIESVDPLLVVGLEGFWGLVFNLFFVLPIAAKLPGDDCPLNFTAGAVPGISTTAGCVYESTADSFAMMRNSTSVFVFTLAYVFIITGMFVLFLQSF